LTTVRRIYRIRENSVDEINRVLMQLMDRLDEIEGYRGASRFFPTGTVYLTRGNINPATLLGFGTWEAIGEMYSSQMNTHLVYVWRKTD
jgi:hypothetical protein